MRKLKKIITAAALAAAMLAGAPRIAAACPYTPGPLGRYIVPAQVLGMYADGDGVQVWCTDLGDGCDWFFTVDTKTDLRIYDRVQLVVEDNDTPDDYTDDRVIDAFYGKNWRAKRIPTVPRNTRTPQATQSISANWSVTCPRSSRKFANGIGPGSPPGHFMLYCH